MSDQHLIGTEQDDTLIGAEGNDWLEGLAGNDTLIGNDGNDVLDGGAGNDLYLPGAGVDRILDSAGIDELRFGPGIAPDQVERLRAENGDLILHNLGSIQQVTIAGWFSRPDSQIEAVVFDNGTVWDAATTSTLQRLGTGGDDFLFGNFDFGGLIEGRGGNDQLFGGVSNDILNGGTGNDSLFGQTGSDTYLFDRTSGHDTIFETAIPGDIDSLIFGANVSVQELIVVADGLNNLQIDIAGADASVRFFDWFNPQLPSRVESFVFQDGTVLSYTQIEAMASVNQAPELDNPIADQTAQSEAAFIFIVPENTFSDPDPGDVLTYSATLGNGDALPEWLLFDSVTRTFVSTPPRDAAGTVVVRVSATDNYGSQASDFFDLTVLYDGIINGTDGADILIGTKFDDSISGLGASDSLYGRAGNDTLYGGAGDDQLDGGSGLDTLQGGTGDDTYVINDSIGGPTSLTIRNLPGSSEPYQFNLDTGTIFYSFSDRNSDGGIDQIVFSYREAGFPFSHFFDLELTTTQLGTNLAPGTYLDAEYAAFATPGHPGLALSGDFQGFGGSGSFTLTTADFDYSGPSPSLIALSVDFELSPTISGTLNYNYSAAGPTVYDSVIENAGEGIDTVLSKFSYTLPANVENLTLTGSANRSGSGNELDNVIIGNSGDNVLFGAAGNDSLSGGAGRDVLDGGAGSDMLQGGIGDDSYVIDDPLADLVIENAGQGIDKVESSVNYTLPSNLEILTLTGNADLNGTGNELGNLLNGNAGANVLAGGAGSDRLLGGAGNDVLDGGADLDTLQGGAGDDTYVVNDVVALGGSTSLTMHSEPGDWVGGGLTYSFNTSSGTFVPFLFDLNQDGQIEAMDLSYKDFGFPNGNSFEVIFSTLQLGVPTTPGLYPDAQRVVAATVGHPGLDVYGNGRGANQVFGSFTVGGVDIDYSGTTPVLRYLSVSFEQHSDSPGAPALFGTLVYSIEPVGVIAMDTVIEKAGEGTDTVMSSVTYALTANVENLTLTGGAAINGTGNSLDNVLIGNSAGNTLSGDAGNDMIVGGLGNDTIIGGLGADTLIGGLGDDTYVVESTTDIVTELAGEGTDLILSSVTLTLAANVENLTLTGTSAINVAGNALNNVLTGNSVNNLLSGGLGADTMLGGLGDDVYEVDNVGDVLIESASQGTDLVQSSVTYTLSANVENLPLTGAGAINGTGNLLDNILVGNNASNTLTGGAGNDSLDGAAGADTMIGGVGNDTYVVDNIADVVTENANEGIDLVQSSLSFTLGNNVENLILTGAAAKNGTGNALDNVLTGNSAVNTLTGLAGNDWLDGGAGADKLLGGLGNDTYVVDNIGDVITENTNAGIDTVRSAVTWTLGAALENLTLIGAGAINGTGNALGNVLIGNSASNTLNGGAGGDIMSGGAGDDTYVVDNVADLVAENLGEGTDLVQSSITYALTQNVENLTLTGTAGISGAGNELDNVITGNSGKNTLTGYAGNDTLIGLGGGDTMIGGNGDDIYVVDGSSKVTENASEGSDTIQSGVGWTLAANFENLILTGSAGINGTGNAVANLLVGNTGNNALIGLAGNDILQGLGGNDILNDSAGNSLFDGGAGTDIMNGNAGNEMFIGGLGNDTITTGAGADLIAFNAGDGQDIVNASTGTDNVLSLGGGIDYASLTFTKSGKNLILKTGGTDQITFKDWYAQGNRSVATLQVFTEAMAGYNPTGGDTLLDNKVEQFNFTALASAFDASGQVNGWALTNALLDWRPSGSGDTEAIGGDLAYQYGLNGSLAGIGLAQAQQVLNAPQLGTANQALRPAAELQTGQIKLS